MYIQYKGCSDIIYNTVESQKQADYFLVYILHSLFKMCEQHVTMQA